MGDVVTRIRGRGAHVLDPDAGLTASREEDVWVGGMEVEVEDVAGVPCVLVVGGVAAVLVAPVGIVGCEEGDGLVS